jgi:hypothetical protein
MAPEGPKGRVSSTELLLMGDGERRVMVKVALIMGLAWIRWSGQTTPNFCVAFHGTCLSGVVVSIEASSSVCLLPM